MLHDAILAINPDEFDYDDIDNIFGEKLSQFLKT